MPFNMAFLSPGMFNVMGCQLAPDPGLPIFHFPGTLPTPVGPVPVPRGLKADPIDEFMRAPGGQYPSMIRIYVSPTLTMGLGVAICLGPMNISTKIPQPFRDIAGNCVVVGGLLPLPCSGDGDGNASDQTVPADLMDSVDGPRCEQPPAQAPKDDPVYGDTLSHSPFSMISAGNGGKTSVGGVNVDVQNENDRYQDALPPGQM